MRHKAFAPLAICFSPNNEHILAASGNADPALRLWQCSDGKPLWEVPREYGLVGFSPSGDQIFAVPKGASTVCHVLRAKDGERLRDLTTKAVISCMAIAPRDDL
jgi:WD40 repeat protein